MTDETALATADDRPTPSPLAIISRAVELKLGADELTKLVALHDQIQANQARAEFQRAMAACQAVMPVIIRDKENQRTKSRYVSLDRVNAVTHPIYTRHGFFVSFTEETPAREGWVRTVATIGHAAGHRETAYIELPRDGTGPKGEPIGGMNAVQGVCSTNTYAERRLICRLFNITVANEDADGNVGPDAADPKGAAKVRELVAAHCPQPAAFWGWVSEMHKSDVDRPEDISRQHMPTVLAELRRKAKAVGK